MSISFNLLAFSYRILMNFLQIYRGFLKKIPLFDTMSFLFRRTFASATKRPIGFIGLGNMGGHMARNLANKGFEVHAFDMNKTAVEEVVAGGGKAAPSVADIAKMSNTIITMLPSNPHVREVYESDNGILANLVAPSLLIDCSTVEPGVSQEMAKLASKQNHVFMDAPVSGGVLAARDGNLTFMLGGPSDKIDEAKAILINMGKAVHHCGDVGTGEAAKICNNLLLAISMVGVSEAMNLGIKLGLDGKVLASIINSATGRCWSSDTYNPVPGVIEGVPSSREYSGGFACALMRKDLGLASAAAKTVNANIPLGSKAENIYDELSKTEAASKDFSIAYQYIKSK